MSVLNLPAIEPPFVYVPRVARPLADLFNELPEHHQLEVYAPACRPLDVPSTGNVHLAVREYVYARDRMTCDVCGDTDLPRSGDRVPSTRFPGHPWELTRRFATLDHIIRRVDGGCHHVHNLRVRCQTCNPRTGNHPRGGRR